MVGITRIPLETGLGVGKGQSGQSLSRADRKERIRRGGERWWCTGLAKQWPAQGVFPSLFSIEPQFPASS